MTKDEILQAMRLTAMGRSGHPLQEHFADALADLFAHIYRPTEPPAPEAKRARAPRKAD